MKHPNHLSEWLADPRMDVYLGRTASLKIAVLAHHLTGQGTLAAIARRFSVSKQALTRHARQCREVFRQSTRG